MKRWLPELLMALLLLGLFVASASIGTTRLTAWDMLAADPAIRTLAGTVVLDIRLPRTVLAVLAGASLGLSGAALQGLLRNPLADPGVVGVSAVASLGAVLAFYFGLWSVAAGGIAGGLAAALLLVALAGRNTGTLTLLLAGVALSSFAVALTSLALNLAPSPLSCGRAPSSRSCSSSGRCRAASGPGPGRRGYIRATRARRCSACGWAVPTPSAAAGPA